MKEIIKALNIYQEIYQLITGQPSEKVRVFLEIVKPYERRSISEFQSHLSKVDESTKNSKVVKTDVVKLGKEFYKMKYLNCINQEVEDFIALSENSKIREILSEDLSGAYAVIEAWNLKDMNMGHLNFLGYGLLNSELRGRTKKDRKKNLLQLLWKVIETEKMNEIYENNLL